MEKYVSKHIIMLPTLTKTGSRFVVAELLMTFMMKQAFTIRGSQRKQNGKLGYAVMISGEDEEAG